MKTKNRSGEREKLEWTDEDVLSSGSVRARITSATKRSGHKLYSVDFFREYNERRSNHFRPADINDVAQLVGEVKIWIEADEGEHRANRENRSKRNANRSM